MKNNVKDSLVTNRVAQHTGSDCERSYEGFTLKAGLCWLLALAVLEYVCVWW
jgi:hypothetical protein